MVKNEYKKCVFCSAIPSKGEYILSILYIVLRKNATLFIDLYLRKGLRQISTVISNIIQEQGDGLKFGRDRKVVLSIRG